MSHILLVEDDPDQREIRRLLFERHGHRISEAASATRALELAGEAPGVVVMDLRLPGPEDGLALIRDLSRTAPGLSIVVLTGFPKDLQGREEADLVKAIVKKPCRSTQLLEMVARFTHVVAGCLLLLAAGLV